MLPVGVSVLLFAAELKTKFSDLPYLVKQVIIGVIFGLVAVFGTENGIDVYGATANARDAAPVCAGLIFGAPAGIIAGVIGGIERWFAVYWGAGEYTRIACTIGTINAGLVAAFARKFIFSDRRCTWDVAGLIAVFAEVVHLSLIFLTHLGDARQAFKIIRELTPPMLILNAVAVALAAMIVSIISKDRTFNIKKRVRSVSTLSERFEHGIIIVIAAAFILAMMISSSVQRRIGDRENQRLLATNISDVKKDIEDLSARGLLNAAEQVAYYVEKTERTYLPGLLAKYKINEINIVDSNGIITQSTDPTYIGYDMASGEQSSEFLCLLNNQEPYFVQEFRGNSFYTEFGSLSNLKGARKYAGWALSDGGFVQVAYDYDRFVQVISEEAADLTANKHVGGTGSIIITDTNFNIISNAKGREEKYLYQTGLLFTSETVPDKVFEYEVYGEDCYVEVSQKEGLYIIALYPLEEAQEIRKAAAYTEIFLQLLIYIFLFFLIFIMVRTFVVDDLHKVNDSLEKITAGDLDEKVNVEHTYEFQELSTAINGTVDKMKTLIDEAKARIDKELEYAKSIQHSAMPSTFPAFPQIKEFDIYANMRTAKEVGGDFYDFYMLNDDTLAFLIADVSGKGIPAALFMMRAKTIIKSGAENGWEVNKILEYANNRLCEGNDQNMFVTGWLGILNIHTGELKYANAGHNPPVIYRKGTGYEYLSEKPGFVLAGMEGIPYRMQQDKLNPGDKVFLYTDGVTEAQNVSRELYGEDRLKECLNSVCDATPKETIESVLASVDAYVGAAEQFDDITTLSLDFRG